MTIRIAILITTQRGKSEDQVAAFALIEDAVRAEQGCLGYDLHRVTNHDEQFLLLEEWESAEALEQHNTSAMMADASVRHAGFRVGIEVLELSPSL